MFYLKISCTGWTHLHKLMFLWIWTGVCRLHVDASPKCSSEDWCTHCPAVRNISCWQFTAVWLAEHWPRLQGPAMPKDIPLARGGPLLMMGWSEIQKPSPLASTWDNTESPFLEDQLTLPFLPPPWAPAAPFRWSCLPYFSWEHPPIRYQHATPHLSLVPGTPFYDKGTSCNPQDQTPRQGFGGDLLAMRTPTPAGQWSTDIPRHAVCLVTLSCLTLCHPMNCSPPGSFVHGDSPGKNTGVGFHAPLQGIFPTQGSNPGLPHCRRVLCHLSHQGSRATAKTCNSDELVQDPSVRGKMDRCKSWCWRRKSKSNHKDYGRGWLLLRTISWLTRLGVTGHLS